MTGPSDADTHRIGAGGVLAGVGRAIRALLLSVGVTTLGLGLLVAFDPETAGVLRIDAAIEALGSDYVVLAVLGLLAVGLAFLLVATRLVRGVSEATPPAVEGVLTATYPGASFDRAGGGRLSRFRSARSTTDRRERLREAAVRATMRAEGCSRTDAGRRVDEGTWTSDSVAASSLSASRRGVLSGVHSGDPADRTVDAILAKMTGEQPADRNRDRAGGGDPDTIPDRNTDRDANGNTDRDADRNPDRDADRNTDPASDRHSDGQSTTQKGVQ